MITIDYPLWKALQEVKDLQPEEMLWVERPVCACGERVIITWYTQRDKVDLFTPKTS